MSSSDIGAKRSTSTDRAIRKRIEKLNDALITDFIKDNKDLNKPELERKRSSLKEEFERPEVQALLLKYNPKSTDFSEFENSEEYRNRFASVDQASSGYQSELPPSPTEHINQYSMDSDEPLRPMLDRNRFVPRSQERFKEVSPRPDSSRQDGSRFTTNRLGNHRLDGDYDTGSGQNHVSRLSDVGGVEPAEVKNSSDIGDNEFIAYRTRAPRPNKAEISPDISHTLKTEPPKFTPSNFALNESYEARNSDNDDFIGYRTRDRSKSPLKTEPPRRFTPSKFDSDRAQSKVINQNDEKYGEFISHRTRSKSPKSPEKHETSTFSSNTLDSKPAEKIIPSTVDRAQGKVGHPSEDNIDGFISHRTRSKSPGKFEGHNSYNQPLKTDPPKTFTPSNMKSVRDFTPESISDGSRSLPARFRSDPPRFNRPESPIQASSSRPRKAMNAHEYAVTNAAKNRLLETPTIVEPEHTPAEHPAQPVYNENSLGIDLYASRIAMCQKPYSPSECSERSSRLDPQTYQSYTAGLLHSTKKSDKFLRMHKFYSNIERVAELEQELGKPSGPADRMIKKQKQKDREVQNELAEVVEDIVKAQKKDKFLYDLGKLDKFHWNPNRERGLLNRPKSLGDLKKVYENEADPLNTSLTRKSKTPEKEDPIQKRLLSFNKLKDKYVADELNASREEIKMKSPVPKSPAEKQFLPFATDHLDAGSKDARKKFVDKKPETRRNQYEVHVKSRESDSSSSESGLHVRSISTPHETKSRQPVLQHSNSYKQSKFSKNDEPKKEDRHDSSREMDSYFVPDRIGMKQSLPMNASAYVSSQDPVSKKFSPMKHDESSNSRNDTLESSQEEKPVLKKFAVAKQLWEADKQERKPEPGLRKFAAAKRYWDNVEPNKDNITKSYVKDQVVQERKLSGNLSAETENYNHVTNQPLKASSPLTTAGNNQALSPGLGRRTEPPKRWNPKPVTRYKHDLRSPYEDKQEITSRWVQSTDGAGVDDNVDDVPFRVDKDPNIDVKTEPKRIEHRAMSTSALTDQDPEYGKLGKWSKINISRDLDKDVAELTVNNLQKWSAMELHHQSFDTESQDTMIVKDVNENTKANLENYGGPNSYRRFESGYSSASTKSPDSPRGLNPSKSVPDIRTEFVPDQPVRRSNSTYKPRPISNYDGWQNPPTVYASSPGAPARPASPRISPQETGHLDSAPRHHFSTSDLPRTVPSVDGVHDRKRRDEEDARRKHYLNILNEENKRKRAEEERKSLEQRRHNDFFLPKQKSPIPEDRFDGVQPPRMDKKHKPLEIRGKAKALYSFKAQNPKELSFRKNDIIYLLRRIDNNWYEAERHGMRGIVPANYIEVMKSIEEAHSLAQKAEGMATLKFKFRKQNPIELDADKGDVVRLIRRVDENWYEARLNDQQGIIPASYLNIRTEPDTPFITPAPSVINSVIHSTVTTPGPGTPIRPLSPLVPDPLSPPEWDFTKFYLPGMPRDTSRDHTLRADRKHNTLPRDFVSPDHVSRDYSSPQRNRYHSESALNPAYHDGSRYGTLDSRRSDTLDSRRGDNRRTDYRDVTERRDFMDSRTDEPLKAYRVMFNYVPQNDDELDIREGDHVYVLERCDDGWFVGTSTRTGQFGTFPGNYVQLV